MNFNVFDGVVKRNKKSKIVTTKNNINLCFYDLFLSIDCVTTDLI